MLSLARRTVLTVVLFGLTAVVLFAAATDVTGQVSIKQGGFTRNRDTGLWTATLTVTNKSGSAVAGPVQVVLDNISSNATLVNKTGDWNGRPYITVSSGALGAGATVNVTVQFTNRTNGFINFNTSAYSGGF